MIYACTTFGLFVFFPWGIPQLQIDWSLSCDHGLDDVNVRTTTTTYARRLPLPKSAAFGVPTFAIDAPRCLPSHYRYEYEGFRWDQTSISYATFILLSRIGMEIGSIRLKIILHILHGLTTNTVRVPAATCTPVTL